MSTSQSLPLATLVSFTITLNSLANVTYVASSAVDLTALDPLDLIVQVEVTPGTVSGNKQAKIFLVFSVDGSNYTTGPTSGTTVTDEPNLYQIGTLPLGTNAGLQRGAWSVVDRLGFVPPFVKLVVFNDSGAAFAGSGCAAAYSTELGLST